MVLTLLTQSKLLFFSIAAGVLTGLIFDFYRTFRGFENIHKFFVLLEDILFWVLAAIIIFIFLLYTNQAIVGVYVYIWMGIGIYLYLKVLSGYFTKIQYTLICWFAKLFRIIFNVILYPFRIIIYSISTKNKRN